MHGDVQLVLGSLHEKTNVEAAARQKCMASCGQRVHHDLANFAFQHRAPRSTPCYVHTSYSVHPDKSESQPNPASRGLGRDFCRDVRPPAPCLAFQ